MKRLIIQIRKFSEIIDQMISLRKLTIEDYEEFEKKLVANPEEGEVIQGTGGVRKTRLKSVSKGKRGGFRICYCDVPEKGKLFLLAIYPKNEKENLSQEERDILKSIVIQLKKEWVWENSLMI